MYNRKLRFAIVGLGGVGHRHLSAIVQSPNAELVALCDPRGPESIQDRYKTDIYDEVVVPEVPFYVDYQQMLDTEQLDAVVISSPDITHAPYAIAAMQHGLDVLCEKPLTYTNEEAVDMMRVAKETGRRVFAGQVCRFSPAFLKVKELLDSGVIGQLFCVESQYVHGCHANLPEDNWRKNPPRHATACGGCHAIDLIRFFAGDPEEVFAYGNRFCRTDWKVEDCSETLMRYPNGMIARVLTTLGCVAEYSMRTVLYGVDGTITANNTSSVVQVFSNETKETVEYPVSVNEHNMYLQVQTMCDAILDGKPVVHEGMEGARSLFVCNAAIESIKTGEKVKLDFSPLENL